MREMKDSGIEWIAHIPSNWTTDRMKYLFTNGKGLSITKENLIETGLPVISYGQIHSKSNSGTDIKDELLRFVDFQYQTNYPQCEVFQYDFVFADTSEDYDGCGNCVYKRDSSLLFGGYHAIILHSLVKRDNRYFAYLFKTDFWRKQLREVASGVKLFSITQKVLMNSSVIVPPEDEQKAIADYLDSKCAELDNIISDIQSQIEALEEYKRSVITEAVTKGLDPDVEMRDSGVQWIGMIPKHWSLYRMATLYTERNERGSDELPLLSVSINTGVSDTELSDEESQRVFVRSEDRTKYKRVYPQDLTYNMMRAWQGAFGAVRVNGMVSPAYVVAKPLKKIDTRYIEALLRTPSAIQEMHRYSYGVADFRLRLYWDKFRTIKVCFPPLEEQHRIADYIDEKANEIDTIIATKQRQIETIEEYKKSLIFEYVTGKKEVQA